MQICGCETFYYEEFFVKRGRRQDLSLMDPLDLPLCSVIF
jgi:hypothetical protein